MTKLLLKFTCNGHKNTYFKRINIFGEPITTNNKESARPIKEQEIPNIIKLLIKEFGKENIKDITQIELQ